MLSLQDNPPIVPPAVGSLRQLAGPWWVAHTRARFEKAFAWDLLQKNVPYFLPMTPEKRVAGGKKRQMMQPLFPSYVFFCGDEEARYTALATNRLCQVIPVRDQEQLIADLSPIHQALAAGLSLEPCPRLPVGARCRIVRGQLEGYDGVVVRNGKNHCVLLQVHFLGQGTLLDIDPSDIELLDPPAGRLLGTKPQVAQGIALHAR